MISEEEARRKILETIRPLSLRVLPLSEALGSFVAEDYFARLPLPAFDNSAMDGYAVMATFGTKGARLWVTGEQPAGRDKQLRIAPGEAIRIFTGAQLRRLLSAQSQLFSHTLTACWAVFDSLDLLPAINLL